MMYSFVVNNFTEWRERARELLGLAVHWHDVQFLTQSCQQSLFDPVANELLPDPKHKPVLPGFRVDPRFVALAEQVSCHQGGQRFNLLYRVLWRMTHGEPHLLQLVTDLDVHALLMMEQAVRRDAHKAKAFVRFRKIETPAGAEHFIAWHRPDHQILKLVAPFFSRRFPNMNWAILTPNESVNWDGTSLEYGPGVPVSEAPEGDAFEELWKTYYANIFNPARVNLKMMTQEMPRRYWKTLPEAEIINDLLAQAPARVRKMIAHQEGLKRSAAMYLPENRTLPELREAARRCEGCELCFQATQTVFGEGSETAKLMLVGEQPGDQEDLAGSVFVGPAGKLLNQAFEAAGIDRSSIYLTNAVKHFKFTRRGKLRLHGKPTYLEILACQPWLEAEIQAVKPSVILCLGVSAAHSVIGRDFKLTQRLGEVVSSKWCPTTIATYHPSAILRARDPDSQARMQRQLIQDLKQAALLSREHQTVQA